VVLVDGELHAYVERGGKTVLLFTDAQVGGPRVADALAAAVREHRVPQLAIEKVDGEYALGTPFGSALQAAGFAPSPKGLRLRA
jgi:ATP-dependent Lhr-like helicase